MKIKRNALCSCQSGKKYKRCCLRAMEEKENKYFKQKANDHFIVQLRPEVSGKCNRIFDYIYAGNDIANVKADVERLYSQYPDDHEINFLCGICSVKEDKFVDAVAYFEKSVQILPYFSEAIYNLGCLYRKEARIPESVDCFRRVLDIEDGDSDLSISAQQELDILDALIKEHTGLTLNESLEVSTLYEDALACLQDKKYEEAILLFQKVLSADTDHVQSYGNIALAYSSLGKNKLALEFVDKALSIDPGYEPALLNKRMIVQLREGEKPYAMVSWVDYCKEVWKT